MKAFYSVDIYKYIEVERLPLWVESVSRGGHENRSFHCHEFSEIALVLQGNARHLVGRSSSEITRGDILVIPPGYTHAYDNAEDLELINIIYDRQKLSLPILDGYSLPTFRIFFPLDSASEQSIVKPAMSLDIESLSVIYQKIQLLEGELKNTRPGNFFISLALFMEVIGLLARHGNNITSKYHSRFLIGNVISFINKNFINDIAIDSLIKLSNMSRRNFFRNFKSTTGYSPLEYLRKIRFQYAVELLLNTNMTINEIATKCGFCDSNYLCRVFRMEMKVSPCQFRKKNGLSEKQSKF